MSERGDGRGGTTFEDARDRTRTALVVHPSPDARRTIERRLRLLPVRALSAVDNREALARLAAGAPDVVIADLGTPGESGLELLRSVRAWSDVPFVVVATVPSTTACRRAMEGGAARFLVWTEGLPDLPSVVASVLERRPERPHAPPIDLAIARARRAALAEGWQRG